MGLVGASLLAILVVNYGVPFWLAAIVALVVGTLFGAIMELIVMRRLFTAPRVIVLVATIGIAGLSLRDRVRAPRARRPRRRPIPSAIDKTWTTSSASGVTGAQLAVLIVVPIVAVALGWFLNRTTGRPHGQGVGREPRPGAASQGINPKVVSTAVWSIAGFAGHADHDPHRRRQTGPANDVPSSGPTPSSARSPQR